MTADLVNPEALSGELGSSDELTSSHDVQTSNMADFARELEAFIVQNSNIFGAADIYNVHLQSPLMLSGMLIAVLMQLVDTDQRSAVHKFVIIVPPGLNEEDCGEKVWRRMITTFHQLVHREIEPRELALLKERFKIIVLPDRRISSVLNVIKIQPERTSIIVTEAASYRDDSIEPYIAAGASSPLLPEDIWAPQLHALATAAVKLAKKCELFVALDANHFSPSRKELSDLLLTIDESCGVMAYGKKDSPDSILASHVDQWTAWIREGRLGRVFRDIEQLPANCESNKPCLRIQMLNKAGRLPEALQAIREELERSKELDASMRVKYARIAQDARASKFAVEILTPAITELHNREDLENALTTAQDAGSTDLEEMVVGCLSDLFPGSPGLRQRLLRTFLAKCDYAGAAAMLSEEPGGDAEFFSTLARFLSGDDLPDYMGLIALAGSDKSQAEAYRMACVRDMLSRKLIPQAFKLVMPLPSTSAQVEQGERYLLRILKDVLLLNGKDGAPLLQSEEFQAAIVSLLERLAAHPENQALRVGLVNLLQPSVAGMNGLVLIAYIVINLSSNPVQLENRRSPVEADISWLYERKLFLQKAFSWLKSESPVVLGRSIFPKSLLTEPAAQVISAIEKYLAFSPIESDEVADSLQQWLALGTSITPHSSNPDDDLRLMKLVATRLARLGHTQLARDIAEQTLLNSSEQ